MKNQIKAGIIATIILLSAVLSQAQVPLQWSRTLQFEGYWEGPITINLAGQIFNVTYHTDFKIAVDGNAITMDEGFSDPNLGELKGANLIGLNAYDGMIHWFSVDNFGTAHDHVGSWINPKHFYMEHQSFQGGQTFTEQIHFRLKANNTKILASLVATLDGDTVQVLNGTLFKQVNGNRIADKMLAPGEISIYPNPNNGQFIIESDDLIKEIKITNQAGQLVDEILPNATDSSLQMKEPGLYFIQLKTENIAETKKVLIIE